MTRNQKIVAIVVIVVATLLSCCCISTLAFGGGGIIFGERASATTTETTPLVSDFNHDTTETTPCGTWNTSPNTTNWLVPGASARGDVVVEGTAYYDDGIGEGTTIINLSSTPIEVFSEWGSGCEVKTSVSFLVNKDLSDGCGSTCNTARIVTCDENGCTQKFYSDPLP